MTSLLVPLLFFFSRIAFIHNHPTGNNQLVHATQLDVITLVREATEEMEETEVRVGENSTEIVSVHVPDYIDINRTVIIDFEIDDVEDEYDGSSLCEGQIDILKCWMESDTGAENVDNPVTNAAAYTSSGNIHFSVGYAQNHLKDFTVFVNGTKEGSLCLKSLITASMEEDSTDTEGSGEISLNRTVELVITSNVNASKLIRIKGIYESDGTCEAEENKENYLKQENGLDLYGNLEGSGDAKESCSTMPMKEGTSGTTASCVFPFIWQGVKYTGCIPGSRDGHIGQDKHWCSTKVDAAGVHMQGYHGECSIQCPFDTMSYFFGQSGLTEVKAYVKPQGGTDDEVKIELSHGWENSSCTTKWLNEWQGWDADNWSNGDTEVYRKNLGNCTNFKANGTAFGFKMIVSNQGVGFGKLRFWNDELCLNKMEFIVQAQKYTWEVTNGETDNCWENFEGPVKIATKNKM